MPPTTCIALFRGINVGGHHILPMKDLAAILEASGHSSVTTYIQSGNVVFAAGKAGEARKAGLEASLSRDIAAAIRKSRGFEPRVIVLTLAALKKAAAANPFPEAEKDPKRVHLFFLAERAKQPNLAALEAAKAKSERFAIAGNVFYLHTPEGFGSSKVATCVERHLGVAATARNWRTVTALIDIGESIR